MMTRKTFVRTVGDHADLHRDPETGIAWVEDGTAGIGHSCHPNISTTGSVAGMILKGYWDQGVRTVRSHGFIYNVDSVVVSDDLDKIARDECRCVGCRKD